MLKGAKVKPASGDATCKNSWVKAQGGHQKGNDFPMEHPNSSSHTVQVGLPCAGSWGQSRELNKRNGIFSITQQLTRVQEDLSLLKRTHAKLHLDLPPTTVEPSSP